MAQDRAPARTVTVTPRAITVGDVVYPLSGLTRLRRGRVTEDGRLDRLAAGLTALLAILALAALLNGLVVQGLALALAATLAGVARAWLRRAPQWSLSLETRSRAREVITSPHRGAIDRLAEALQAAIEGTMDVSAVTVDLDLATVETRLADGAEPERTPAPSFGVPPVAHTTRWHRPTVAAPDGIEEELAVFSREVRASFADDDWASERVLLLLESEIVSPAPRHRLAENLWKELRAAAPRAGRLEAEFRRLLDWPRGGVAA